MWYLLRTYSASIEQTCIPSRMRCLNMTFCDLNAAGDSSAVLQAIRSADSKHRFYETQCVDLEGELDKSAEALANAALVAASSADDLYAVAILQREALLAVESAREDLEDLCKESYRLDDKITLVQKRIWNIRVLRGNSQSNVTRSRKRRFSDDREQSEKLLLGNESTERPARRQRTALAP
ncbi:hypothetical protein FA13DRAFT_1717157 [Coprinellus micaceus]|uniref:Uncharacterized protein n=1 Tax=Coprinellus micaceus TaxID=71717 RepID=A0A4Y7SH77_COPMI|nr:hypothetical protein FA13DRAFT_1717157 [Coprinellus micaceus]